ncbi:LuxR C-terminal-related transcriptional regulator [Actinoplanes rectilineatus]|uniref:LuxR C-terminal-related transcriptional regulator n=1 Tax=Actinoplanes rectilineatus TaxID=113571 RepID=UPI000A5945AC|nr:LuxR C-terminal-related transcriptional regulator [Actinoplanes rectilineatus]
MNDLAVRLTGITRRFGPVRAVDDVALSITKGSLVALLGPNGAGKTTTIAVMLGLIGPDSGTATLFGGPPADAVRAGRIGAMLQDAGEKVIDPALAAAALSAGPNPLTDRERDVLAAGTGGATVADIASRLHLSESTVRNYLSAAIGKTGTRNRIEAAHRARDNGWI